ncbi:MAG: CPXCG motif-containing cysteine-rich protein [Polyangiaceae bacterium]|nr:CPXCG motif-containing cysteine-rich protein [Polyangiaceae bacterium]
MRCPHCGETIQLQVDEGGGDVQEYIEDCEVCCRAIRFHIHRDPESGEFDVTPSADV